MCQISSTCVFPFLTYRVGRCWKKAPWYTMEAFITIIDIITISCAIHKNVLYQDMWWCVVWPKKMGHAHTSYVSILTGTTKSQFSHIRSSVIFYPIDTKCVVEVPAFLGRLHTKFRKSCKPFTRYSTSGQTVFFLHKQKINRHNLQMPGWNLLHL